MTNPNAGTLAALAAAMALAPGGGLPPSLLKEPKVNRYDRPVQGVRERERRRRRLKRPAKTGSRG